MSDRNLGDVIDAMLVEIPEQETDLRDELGRCKTDSGFTAPEMMQQHWVTTANVLQDHLGGVDSPKWVRKVVSIWMDKPLEEPVHRDCLVGHCKEKATALDVEDFNWASRLLCKDHQAMFLLIHSGADYSERDRLKAMKLALALTKDQEGLKALVEKNLLHKKAYQETSRMINDLLNEQNIEDLL